jgi:hypothetical protein
MQAIEGKHPMIRKLKVLPLALLAAMGTVAVSVASADTFTSAGGVAVTLTGKETGTGDVITTTAGTAKCREVTYTGTSASGVTTVTLVPNYPIKTTGGEQNCTGFGFPAEINMNGCSYLFHIAAATTGTMDIVCPEGKEITITAATAGIIKCIVHVPAETGLGPITYKNTGSGATREIEIEANVTGLVYRHTAGSGLGACTTGQSTAGSYVGKAIVTGETDGGSTHVGIFLV